MNVIPPLSIDDAILSSSSVSEPDAGSPSTEFVYDSGTTYALGDEVISTSTHKKYESLAAGNLGNALTDTTKWLDIGSTNKWAMFDQLRNTGTIAQSPLTVVLLPGIRISAIVLLGLEATSATVEMTSAGSPVEVLYTYTEDLNTREVLDWYDYFFEPFSTKPSLALFDLPPYANAILTVTITNTEGDAACGALVIGAHQYIGETEHSAESDALNYSTITRDVFGNATLVQRRSIPKANVTVICEKSLVNAILDLRTALNAEPAVWSCVDDSDDGYFEALLILGIYRKFTINAADPTYAVIDLELEEI